MKDTNYRHPKFESLMDDSESITDETEIKNVEDFQFRFYCRYESELEINYCELPFIYETFDSCATRALKCEVQKRKPMAIYLHVDNAVGWYQFPMLVADPNVCALLENGFRTFTWDCSTSERKFHIEKKIGQLICDTSFSLNHKQLPCLLIIVTNERDKFVITDYVTYNDLDLVVCQLENSMLTFNQLIQYVHEFENINLDEYSRFLTRRNTQWATLHPKPEQIDVNQTDLETKVRDYVQNEIISKAIEQLSQLDLKLTESNNFAAGVQLDSSDINIKKLPLNISPDNDNNNQTPLSE